MNIELARHHMIVQQIRPWGVLDEAVLEQLDHLPREAFVPAAYKSLAFADMELPLGHGQYMLSPKVQARMVADVRPQRHERVALVGAGSGYVAALLARLAAHVIAYENVPELADLARRNLDQFGCSNVEVRNTDGAQAPQNELFDAVVLAGGLTQLPADWLATLKSHGRLFVFLGEPPVMRATLVTRRTDGGFDSRSLWDTVVPALAHFAPQPAFVF